MTVIECICAKCGKPFIWVVIADTSKSWMRYVECPHCKSNEVGLWHYEVRFPKGMSGGK